MSLALITSRINPGSSLSRLIPRFPRYRARKRDKEIRKWRSTFARSKIYLLTSAFSSQINSLRPCNDAGTRIFPPALLSTTSRFRPSSKLVSTQVCLDWKKEGKLSFERNNRIEQYVILITLLQRVHFRSDCAYLFDQRVTLAMRRKYILHVLLPLGR